MFLFQVCSHFSHMYHLLYVLVTTLVTIKYFTSFLIDIPFPSLISIVTCMPHSIILSPSLFSLDPLSWSFLSVDPNHKLYRVWKDWILVMDPDYLLFKLIWLIPSTGASIISCIVLQPIILNNFSPLNL